MKDIQFRDAFLTQRPIHIEWQFFDNQQTTLHTFALFWPPNHLSLVEKHGYFTSIHVDTQKNEQLSSHKQQIITKWKLGC